MRCPCLLRFFLFLLSLLLLQDLSAVHAGSIKQGSSPAGTSDTVQTPPVGPSSVERPVAAGRQTAEVVPGDASVVPSRDMST